jgi:hypothetical protein
MAKKDADIKDRMASPANCQLPTANCLLPTAYCLLPTAYCLLPTAYCLLSIPSTTLPTASGFLAYRTALQSPASLQWGAIAR